MELIKEKTNKASTLAEHLDCHINDFDKEFNNNYYYLGDKEYLVLTDDEADNMAKEYIKETIWAFSSWFLSKHTNIDEEIIEQLQDKCEGANEPLLRSIIDIDAFIDEAIGLDGRGHFMSTYDGQEIELNDLYIYRIN